MPITPFGVKMELKVKVEAGEGEGDHKMKVFKTEVLNPFTPELSLFLKRCIRQPPRAAEAENTVRVKVKNEGEGHCKPKTSTAEGTKSMEGQRGGLLKVSQVSVRHLSIVPSI